MKSIIECADAVFRLFRNRDGNIPISTRLTVLLTVVLCGGWFFPVPAAAEEFAIPFAEEILTVQDDRVESSKHPGREVSIPYTRLDVMIRDGIAFMRLIQVYHNHGDINQGFAFSLPLQPDTAITGFTIWDRGIRYPGAIEDRPRAEKAYQEVTGDETPTMKRDPGLVRRTRNRFEMRVFPIFPGEDKQIELFWHRRLTMKDGEFVFTLPLNQLTRLYDSRHGSVSSRLTDISVYLEDDLPITGVSVSGEFLKEQRLDEHRRLFRGLVKNEPVDELQVVYSLKLARSPSVKTTTFSEDGEKYFLIRLLARLTEQLPEPEDATEDDNPFYIGVWHLPGETPHSFRGEIMSLREEMAAFFTLMVLDKEGRFHGSWLPIGGGILKFKGTMTAREYRVKEFLRTGLKEVFKRGETGGDTPPPEGHSFLLAHLSHAIAEGGCNPVYLFLDGLSTGLFEDLEEVIDSNPDIRFYLVFGKGGLPPGWSRPNVYSYSLSEGWKYAPDVTGVGYRHLLLGADTNEFFWAFLGGGDLRSFLEVLPNLDPDLPSLRSRGEVLIDDAELFPADDLRRQEKKESGEWACFWLSGTFDRTGELSGEIIIPQETFIYNLWGEGTDQTAQMTVFRVPFNTNPTIGEKGNRYVGVFTAQHIVARLNGRIAFLEAELRSGERSPAGEEGDPQEKKAEVERLRRAVVGLSKAFSFISSETAFIALPEELRKKYGFIPQQYTTGQLYGLKGGKAAVVPEPETWLLIIGGAIMSAYFIWWRRWKIRGIRSNSSG